MAFVKCTERLIIFSDIEMVWKEVEVVFIKLA